MTELSPVIIYLLVALCTYIALPDNTIWSGLSNGVWRIRCFVLAAIWPLTVLTALLKRLLND